MSFERWTCRICGQEQHTRYKTCLKCNISRQQAKQIWFCPKCTAKHGKEEALNIIESKQCQKCGTRKRRSVKVMKLVPRHVLVEKIKSIRDDPKNQYNPQRLLHSALISLLYLTGGRISELLWDDRQGLEGLKKSDLDIQDVNGVSFLIITLPTLKRRPVQKGDRMLRKIPINVEKEWDFLEFVFEYLETIPRSNTILFPVKRQWAWKVVQTKMGREFTCHFFRHQRLSDLVVLYGFTGHELKQYVNWSSVKSSDSYVSLDYRHLAKKLS